MSVQMQQEAQRSRLRGAVVEMLKTLPEASSEEMTREELLDQIEKNKTIQDEDVFDATAAATP